ncbi:anthranilate phosphoribosyltransferase [Evansella sp. AB-rgal1]|uniref:anthranilate phosphoribosyltransferase n=1 Tax=Evansella sp. AB-rgal1 TaxID=3242696 RepID=UPI00359D54A9
MKLWLKEVARGKKGAKDLTYELALEAAKDFISGDATDAQIGAFLVAQRLKQESIDEVLAFVKSYREVAQLIPNKIGEQKQFIDLAGPYSGRNTFAVTIPAALLFAERGIPVYLHSSDSLPPRYGSSLMSILGELGVSTEISNEDIGKSIETIQIGFAWTEKLCPPLANLRHIREEIGVRSFFNVMEKVLNLANANHLMIGVFHKTVVELHAALIRNMGYEKGFIVQGAEGSEDLPIHRRSFIYEVTKDNMESFLIDPNEYGLKLSKDEEKENLSLQKQANVIRRLLEGEESDDLQYHRNQLLFNVGVRYFLFGIEKSIDDGIKVADMQLKQQRGAIHLEKWITLKKEN